MRKLVSRSISTIPVRKLGNFEVSCIGICDINKHENLHTTSINNGVNLFHYSTTGNDTNLLKLGDQDLTSITVEPLKIGLYDYSNADIVHIDVHALQSTETKDYLQQLEDLKTSGKIRAYGLANANIDHINAVKKIHKVLSVLNVCNLLNKQDLDNDVISKCEDKNIAYLALSPIPKSNSDSFKEAQYYLKQIAGKHGCSTKSISLAWLLLSPNVIPVPTLDEVSVEDISVAVNIEFDITDLEMLQNIDDL